MRELAVSGRRTLAVEEDWDQDYSAIGLLIDRDLGKSFQAPVGVVLSRGFWRDGSGRTIKDEPAAEPWSEWPS